MAKVKDLATVLTVGLGTIAFGVTSVVIAVSVAHGMWQENRVWYRNMSKAKVGMSIQDGQPVKAWPTKQTSAAEQESTPATSTMKAVWTSEK